MDSIESKPSAHGKGGTTPQFFGVELDFDDKIEFCLRKTRFLVMELPRHRGTGLVELQVFISQYPFAVASGSKPAQTLIKQNGKIQHRSVGAR